MGGPGFWLYQFTQNNVSTYFPLDRHGAETYLYEALEVDGADVCELRLTPAIDRDIHALFLRQIASSIPRPCTSLSPIRPAFICPSAMPAFLPTSGCYRCRPTAPHSIPSNVSAASSKPPSRTGSI